jgi:hypothetical protein
VPGWPQVVHREVDEVPLQIRSSLMQASLPLPPLPPVPPVGAALQQTVPELPQLMQILLLHFVLVAVQLWVLVLVPFMQQAWPGPPQVTHEPFVHTPVLYGVHDPPCETHRLPMQQPPFSQALPSQQGVPGLPQFPG